MDAFTLGITRRRRLVIAIFLICTVVCAVLFLGVGVNYDLTDYLPEDAESTVALDIMMSEFGSGVPNTRVTNKLRQRRKVDLPEPEGPMMTTFSPSWMVSLMSSSTR